MDARTDLDARLADDTIESLRSNGLTGTLGSLALALVYLGLSWHDAHHGLLSIWLATAVVAGISLAFTLRGASAGQRRDRHGLPLRIRAAHAFTGAVWGFTFVLAQFADRADDRPLVESCVVFALSAGAAGGAGNPRLAADVLIPAWGIAAVVNLIDGQWLMAVGSAAFLLIIRRDIEIAGTQYDEVRRLRFSSELEARAATRRSETDPLTGLTNRLGLARLTRQMRREGDGVVSILFIDLDRFKRVNDSLGHRVGDDVLMIVADRLLTQVRHGDVVCRNGGDEFLVVARSPLRSDAVDRLAASILEAIAEPMAIGDHRIEISASIGVTRIPARDVDMDRAYDESDRALYVAKASGRGHAVTFETSLADGDSGLQPAHSSQFDSIH